MAKGHYHRPWYLWAARLALLCALALVLWVSALSSPFIAAHIVEVKGAAARLRGAAAFGVSALLVISVICYLLDRV